MNSVIKGSSYILVHTPDMVLANGTTQTTERVVNPESEYLKSVPQNLRSYDDAVAYYPNQTYIGNFHPDELAKIEMPWYDKKMDGANRYGKFGEIMPQEEFLLMVAACDMFEVVKLDKDFVASHKDAFAKDPIITEDIVARIPEGTDPAEIKRLVEEEHAEGFWSDGKLVGCVKRAHDIDTNLSAHVMHENLVSKASSVLALLYGVRNAGIDKSEIEYVIDCAEEACGDMNQRGGGNFAKAAAEVAGLVNATGSDVRGFCAAPAHAVIEAASLVKSGAYKTVAVTSGGCTAKLGMNGKDHIKKGLPILEDCLGGFCVIISENDGNSAEINLEMLGRHKVGTGSSPQAVISGLVTDPLDKFGLKILDIDKYSPEMQNPDITKPAGAGDVPLANYKMIGALAAKRGEMTPKDLNDFVSKHGLTGWAPTQGHIPSGVPYIGYACEDILSGKIKNAMIIGKGSLFLGRMTNLFDGVSFIMQGNTGKDNDSNEKIAIGNEKIAKSPVIAITGMGSEHGEETSIEGALLASKLGVDVRYIGSAKADGVKTIPVKDEDEGHHKMEELLNNKEIDGAVTMHYPFPIGVATVGLAVTPSKGKKMFIATTTGTTGTDRIPSMVTNAICGIIAAKACGVKAPKVGILNIDGARQTEIKLRELKSKGYDISFADSAREGGGAILRGNDVLTGSADVLVCDSLTGNVLSKMLSAFSSGGSYETVGFGYGPGIGEGYDKLVLIISRASGAPVIGNALKYASDLVDGNVFEVANAEFKAANVAGLKLIAISDKNASKTKLSGTEGNPDDVLDTQISEPKKEPVTAQIAGIEIMDLEDGVAMLKKNGIYAESGMGCTGPIILVSEANLTKAEEELKKAGFIAE